MLRSEDVFICYNLKEAGRDNHAASAGYSGRDPLMSVGQLAVMATTSSTSPFASMREQYRYACPATIPESASGLLLEICCTHSR